MRDQLPPRPYDDIIDVPYPFDMPQPRMDRASRAAQFSPYKALTGYEDMVTETARLTDPRGELDEGTLAVLNHRLQVLADSLDEHPLISVTYFVRDRQKTGGAYRTVTERAFKLDLYDRMLVLASRRAVPIDDIFMLTGEVFERAEQQTD